MDGDPFIGTALGVGGLEVIDRLARTSFATVYRARGDVGWAAVKLLDPIAADDEAMRDRFAREIEIVRALDGRGAPRSIAVGEIAGRSWLATELVAGQLLAHRMAAGTIPVVEAVRIGIAILDALEQVHRLGVVHRDLKPSNVMLVDGGARLIDFGAAAYRHGSTEMLPLGTPAYVAPEQAAGGAADARADLYAAGVMLYEMMCGRRPFLGEPIAVLRAHELAAPPRPRDLVPSLPVGIEAIVLRALAKDPDHRWPSSASFRDALASDLQRGAIDVP